MHSWNMGYDTETNYTFKYFGNLNPHVIRFNFLAQGLAFPKLDHNFTACELGFGNGISLLIHGAASQGKWYGNDFNPSQVEFAKQFANHSGINAELFDDAFDEFLKRDDLPMFDYICLHGIWSWVSPENQDVIVEFVKNKLKVGGVLYVSYNVKAGFSQIAPFRCIINSYINNLGDPSKNSEQHIPDALEFIDKLMAVKPQYTKDDWVCEQYKLFILDQDQKYLAHEYTNGYWQLQSFNQVAAKFEQAKLSYVCQAKLAHNIDSICLNTVQKKVALAPYLNTPMYQEFKDFVVRNSFRTDVYVKGPVSLSNKLQNQELDKTYFICCHNLESQEYSIVAYGLEHKVDLEKIAPILEIVKDNKCHGYQELRERLCIKSAIMSEDELFDKVVYAVASGMLFPACDPKSIEDGVVQSCQQFNNYILSGNQSETMTSLASPVLGGGVLVNDMDKVILKLTMSCHDLTKELLAQVLSEALNQDGTQEREYINNYIEQFLSYKLPLYKNLMLV